MWTEEERLFLEAEYIKKLKEQGLLPESTPISSPYELNSQVSNWHSKNETISHSESQASKFVIGEMLLQEDERSVTEKQQYKQSFFKAYASHLRVQTRIDGLCKLKQQLKLPMITSPRMTDVSPRPFRERSQQIENERIVKDIKANILEQTSGSKNTDRRNFEKRSFLLAHSPKEQFALAIAAAEKNSPRLVNRSMLNGANLKIKEGRFSVLQNTPSGFIISHPKSRVPDDPNLLEKIYSISSLQPIKITNVKAEADLTGTKPTNTRQDSGRKRSNQSSLTRLLSDEETSLQNTQTKINFGAIKSQSIKDPAENIRMTLRQQSITTKNETFDMSLRDIRINRVQSLLPQGSLQESQRVFLSPNQSMVTQAQYDVNNIFVINQPQNLQTLKTSRRSLPPMLMTPLAPVNNKSPFVSRNASLADQLQRNEHLKRIGSLSPDIKNLRVQHILFQNPSLATKDFNPNKTPQKLDLNQKKETDDHQISKKIPTLEQELKLLGQKLESSGAFQSVEERNYIASQQATPSGKIPLAKHGPSDKYISQQSQKALQQLEPDQVQFTRSQTHADSITKHFNYKMERATDIILSVVYSQNKEIQNSIEVLDFMQRQGGKRLFQDYFEAKNELKKIEKINRASKLEVQKAMGETSSELSSNLQSTRTFDHHPASFTPSHQKAYPQKISILGFGVSGDLSHEASSMTPSGRPLQQKKGYQTPMNYGPQLEKNFNSAEQSRLTNRNQSLLGAFSLKPIQTKQKKILEQLKTQEYDGQQFEQEIIRSIPPSIFDESIAPDNDTQKSEVKLHLDNQQQVSIPDKSFILEDHQYPILKASVESVTGKDSFESESFSSSQTGSPEKDEVSSGSKRLSEPQENPKGLPYVPSSSLFKPTLRDSQLQKKILARNLSDILEKDEKPETYTNTQNAINVQNIIENAQTAENAENADDVLSVPKTPSVNSEGVHDLCLYQKYLDSPSKLRTTGIYQKLKADTFVKEPLFENAMDSYDLSFGPAKKFFNFCLEQKQQGFPINPYPILHQLYQGRLFVKNQEYSANNWRAIFKVALDFSHHYKESPLRFIYFEDCDIPDETLVQLVKTMNKCEDLQEIIFVKIQLGEETVTAINRYLTHVDENMTKYEDKQLHLMSKVHMVQFMLYQCSFAATVNLPIEQYEIQHPILANRIIPLRHLCLSRCFLLDGHLEMLQYRLHQMQSLDISFNKFTSANLLKFLQKLIKNAHHASKQAHNIQKSTALHSINVAGNSLKHCTAFDLNQILPELVKLTNVSHIDFSLMDIDLESVQAIVIALKSARSIQSIHLTSQRMKQMKQIVHEVLGSVVFDRISMKRIPQEVSADWNDEMKLPNTNIEEITANVNSSFCNQRIKNEHVRRIQEIVMDRDGEEAANKIKSYPDTRYVLSRIIGRPDLSNHFNRMKRDPVTGKQKDVTLDLSDAMRYELIQKRRNLDEVCWVESQECWCCERWSYILPVICRSHIDDCFLGEFQEKECLTDVQEKVLQRIIEQNQEVYNNLELRVPYIVGECTNLQFIKCQRFTDYLLMVDPEAEKVRNMCKNKMMELQQYYAKNDSWKQVLRQSTKFEQQIPENTVHGHLAEKQTCLNPFVPHISMHQDSQIGMFDLAWVSSMIARPGKANYFVIYRFDDTRTFKTEMKIIVPPRPMPMHHHVLPKLKLEQDSKNTVKEKKDDNYYFNVFNQWILEDKLRLKQLLQYDARLWKLNHTPHFPHGREELYQGLIFEIQQNTVELMSIFRELQSNTESFPLLNSVQLTEWFQNVNVINNTFTVFEFQQAYDETKISKPTIKSKDFESSSPILKRKSTKINLGGIINTKRSGEYKFSKSFASEDSAYIARHQWYELLVRIAIKKFKMADKNENKTNWHVLSPAECFKRLMHDHLTPFYNRLKKQFSAPQEFFKRELFGNKDVQKYIFLNQFELNKIYEGYLAERYEIYIDNDQPQKEKLARKSIKRKFQPPKMKFSKHQVARSLMIDEKDEIEIEERSPDQDQSGQDDFSPSKAKIMATPNKKNSIQEFSPMMKRSSSLIKQPQFQKSETFLSLSLSVVASFQAQEQKQSLDKNNKEDSDLNERKSDPQEAESEMQSIDIQIPSGSPSPKKISFIEPPLPKKKEAIFEFGIEFNELLDKSLKFIPSKYKMMSKKTFQYCFSLAKMAKAPSGGRMHAFENDRKRMSHLNFIEFVVFLCLLAYELNRDEIVDDNKPFLPFMKATVEMLLKFFEIQATEVPPEGEDTRGDQQPLYLLIGNKLEPYSPPTPEHLRESGHADFYSEQSDVSQKLSSKKMKQDYVIKRQGGTVNFTSLKRAHDDSPTLINRKHTKQRLRISTEDSFQTEIYESNV